MKKPSFSRWVINATLIGLLVSGFAASGLAAGRFITGFDDLPLMPGMTEIPDTDVSFDTTAGRIVIAFVRTPADRENIMAFYQTTLAQLGWREHSEAAFLREEEVLSFDYLSDGPDTIVRFSLLPQ
jgi:hypothetical protein